MREVGRKRGAEFITALGAGLGLLAVSAVGFAPDRVSGLCGAALSSSLALLSFAWAMAAAIAVGNPLSRAALFQINPAPRPLPHWALALAVAGTLALSHLLGLIVSATDSQAESAIVRVNALLADASGGALLAAVAALAIAPALSEEILFRGLLLGRFCDRLGTAGGLVLSSLLLWGDPSQPCPGCCGAGPRPLPRRAHTAHRQRARSNPMPRNQQLDRGIRWPMDKLTTGKRNSE